MHKVLVNRLSLPMKSVVRLTDRPNMTLDVYCGRKTTIQQQQQLFNFSSPVQCTRRAIALPLALAVAVMVSALAKCLSFMLKFYVKVFVFFI